MLSNDRLTSSVASHAFVRLGLAQGAGGERSVGGGAPGADGVGSTVGGGERWEGALALQPLTS